MYQSAFEYVEPFESYGLKLCLQCCWWGGGDIMHGGHPVYFNGSGQNRVDVDIPAAGSCGWSLAGVERQPGDGRARAGT